ncbi:MAG: AEC family transporter [Desulfopila sp.]|jgi:predicted permease|nr:AEC family transporter [Desulfopila sp.]
MEKLLFTLGLILSGLILGYVVQRADMAGLVKLPVDRVTLRKWLQKIGLLFFMPISFLGAVWIVSFGDLRVVWLPVIGLVVLLCGGGLGLLAARFLGVAREQKGVMYCCGSFTNIGAIGALVCFVFLGEAGFALVALYKMFEEISYYTVGFPIARYYGAVDTTQGSLLQRAGAVVKDPFVATVLAAFFIGLSLNLSAVPRPVFFDMVTALFVPLGTFVLIVSIGLGMRFSSVGRYTDKCVAVSIIKFICLPLLGGSLAYACGLHQVADGLPFKVVLLLSSMPVAFNALVAASIFDLDLDLANSLWLVTTAMLVVVLPWLYFLVSAISG